MTRPARNTFPRSVRILSKPDFDRLFREGIRASDELMTLLGGFNAADSARLGISVPRRFGNAVQRNRIKRLIREVFRVMRHDLPAGTDWIAVPRPAGRQADLCAVRESLHGLTHRIGRRMDRLATEQGSQRQQAKPRRKSD